MAVNAIRIPLDSVNLPGTCCSITNPSQKELPRSVCFPVDPKLKKRNGSTCRAQGVGAVADGSRENGSGSPAFDLPVLSDSRPREGVVDREEAARRLDQWVKESVEEIVSNLDEAPFLVHIYRGDGSSPSPSSTPVRLVREKADVESWPLVTRRWDKGSPMPDGVILVEELQNREGSCSDPQGELRAAEPCATTRVWGVLIQGKGTACASCYILKTCRVRSVLGFCTHFCLARAECPVESADVQLRRLWLQS